MSAVEKRPFECKKTSRRKATSIQKADLSMGKRLVLASASPFRRQLMKAAGLEFVFASAAIDERAIEQPLVEKGATPEEVAGALAAAKARDVALRYPDDFVLGADQVMSMNGGLFHKCNSIEAARNQLASMKGRSHRLSSALAIVQGGRILWSHVSNAEMTFRDFSDSFLDFYIEMAGDNILKSVGAYQYEGLGQQLFEKVEGDYFTIIGLPMLPLLAELRALGVIID